MVWNNENNIKPGIKWNHSRYTDMSKLADTYNFFLGEGEKSFLHFNLQCTVTISWHLQKIIGGLVGRRVLKWLLFFIFLFAPQGIKRRKRERMVFDKNTQVCTITCLYNHVDYNLLRAWYCYNLFLGFYYHILCMK